MTAYSPITPALRAELEARLSPGAAPPAPGAEVRVTAVEGIVLTVAP